MCFLFCFLYQLDINSFWILITYEFKADLSNGFSFLPARTDLSDTFVHPLWKLFGGEPSSSRCDSAPLPPPHASTLHPQSQIHKEVSLWACWGRFLWLHWPQPHQTPLGELNADWEPGLIASLQLLWLQRRKSLQPLYFIFFFSLFFCKHTKDEVTKLEWLIHWEFMFCGNCFHFSNRFKFVSFVCFS